MLLAESATAILDILAPVVVMGLAMLAVIIGILTRHQRNMAMIIHNSAPQSDGLAEELRAIRRELQSLEAKVDSLSTATPHNPLADRLTETEPGKTLAG